MLLLFTGFARNSSDIAGEQIKKTPENKTELKIMMEIVDEAIAVFRNGADIKDFGRLLHESWKLKRSLTNLISTSAIDAMYESARGAGAIGGKLLGGRRGRFSAFVCLSGKTSRHKRQIESSACPLPF